MLVTNLLFFVSPQRPSGRASRRGQRGKLRKFQEIDHVVVEEPFSLTEPTSTTTDGAAVSNGDKKAGEGCYVSATYHNRRYYGMLVDQAALKAASLLHFQDEASGLDLNRRMKALKGQQESNGFAPDVPTELNGGDMKRPAMDDVPAGNDKSKRQKTEPTGSSNNSALAVGSRTPQIVQKFRYVEGTATNQGYRLLIATYADIEAAVEDDVEKAKAIEAACGSGGNYVGKYYFQYQVRLWLGLEL